MPDTTFLPRSDIVAIVKYRHPDISAIENEVKLLSIPSI